MRRVLLLSIVGFAIAGPTAAADRCNQPYAPIIKADSSVTVQQIATLREDVKAFIAASDIYQKCLIAKNDISGKIKANQEAKARVAQEFNVLVKSIKGSGS
jgi:hypothetical protein